MKQWFACLCLPVLLAAVQPVPLVTGAVRDQFGEPIAGATVQAGAARTTTDAGGTFAIQSIAEQVRISCRYCQTVAASVASDGTVAAIVQRYEAPAGQNLSASDLRALPYAHAESALALQPFVMLTDTTRTLPGPYVSYYGLSPLGGLVVADGFAAYDIAAGVTPFRIIPSYDTPSLSAYDSTQAFRYGDLASGGSFFLRSQTPQTIQGALLNGTQRAANLSQSNAAYQYSIAGSEDDDENRSRVFASVSAAAGPGLLSGAVVAARGASGLVSTQNEGMIGARLHFEDLRALHAYAELSADRASYSSSTAAGLPVDGEWSDFSVQSGIRTEGVIQTFADAGARFSTGYYDPAAIGGPRTAGTTLQSHVSAGAQQTAGALSWQAGIGAFDVRYTGGSGGSSAPLLANIVAPSASITLWAGAPWSVQFDANQSFRLPTLVEAYGYGADTSSLYYDRYTVRDAKLTFTDLRRLRVQLIALRAGVGGLDNGTVTATGASLGWQISPELALRAWTMHVNDTALPYAPVFRFGVAPSPATPASLWASYTSANRLRADVIWRGDVLDYRPDVHMDAAISGPLAAGFRWFIGSERRRGNRYISAGLRLAK